MKIYDISREMFSAKVYPGDPVPSREAVLSLEQGDPCNLSRIVMGSHSGTHVDAPVHFCAGGKSADEIALEKCVGECKVVSGSGVITEADMKTFLADGTKKLLIKGSILLTVQAAEVLAEAGADLLGVEGQTVGDAESQQEIHRILLGAEIVILEGIVLDQVEENTYFLAALPLKMQGADGSPVRPILVANWKNP